MAASKIQALWNHPAGPKTSVYHFLSSNFVYLHLKYNQCPKNYLSLLSHHMGHITLRSIILQLQTTHCILRFSLDAYIVETLLCYIHKPVCHVHILSMTYEIAVLLYFFFLSLYSHNLGWCHIDHLFLFWFNIECF